MAMILVENLSFGYPGSFDMIFNGVSFRMDSHWKLGLIGRNGRGKTTLLRLLMGEYSYSGNIIAGVPFAYFPYAVPDAAEETMKVLAAANPNCAPWQILCETRLLELSEEVLYRPFSTLSYGEQTKALLAALFAGEERFLLLDEPTNHLDLAARRVVADYLKKKHGFILVSHDRALLDDCVNHILSINRADITIQQGNFSTWQENKERQDAYEWECNEKLKGEIRELKASARQAANWSDNVEKSKKGKGSKVAGLRPDRGHIGHKAAKMMKRSKNLENRMENAAKEKEKLLRNIEETEPLKMLVRNHPKEELLRVQDLAVAYDGITVCSGISFSLHRGERICLSGENGTGKSSILKVLLGENINYSGIRQIAAQTEISYVPQVFENWEGTLFSYAKSQTADETLFLTILRKFGMAREQFEKNINDLSAGQKKKVLLAKSLCTPAHLYIWDEPLNYIDVFSRMQIEEVLLFFRPTMIFVEHDPVFCDKIATKTVTLSAQKQKFGKR